MIGRQVEPLLEQRAGAVPGVEQPTAGDAVDADALEDDLLRTGRAWPASGVRAEQRHAAAVGHHGEALVQGAPTSRTSRARRRRRCRRSRRAAGRCTSSTGGSSTRSAPMRSAIARRSGLMSVAKTARAPAFLSTAMLIRPIGPQPVTTAVWPATSSTKVAKTALPSGSWSAAISKRQAFGHPRVDLRDDRRTGQTCPGCGRRGCACSGRRRRVRCGTGSRSSRRRASRRRPVVPIGMRVAPGPRSTTTPAISWPKIIGGGPKLACAHGSQRSMWTSVPHTLAAWTRTRTSPGPGCGNGHLANGRAGRGALLDRAPAWSCQPAERRERPPDWLVIGGW